MKSFSLLRTNVALTTNVKISVTKNYGLFLDSIDSKPELSIKNLKKVGFNKESPYEYVLPKFWSNTPYEDAYYVKDDNDVDLMYTEFSNQYDTIYNCGARNIANNKDYDEEFEYFAPLHISKNYLPTNFIIFRIDGPGLVKLTRQNFRSEILDKMKCIKVFDLTKASDLGIFLNSSIVQNRNFPNHACEISFEDLYSNINGIKYPIRTTNSGYVEESFFLDFKREMTFYDMQKYITDRFRLNYVIYPHILNLNFLFDDTPATPTSLRKWSLNRYMGFYFDSLELVTTVSPSKLYDLKNDVYIDKENYLVSISGGSPFTDENLVDVDNLYISINKKIYRIKEYIDINTFQRQKTNINPKTFRDLQVRKQIKRYKVLSDIPLYKYAITSSALLNQILIKYVNEENLLLNMSEQPFVLDDWDDCDMWLIKIAEDYFKLSKNVDGTIIIKTDYAFVQTDTKFEYYINDPDPKYRKSYDISLKLVKEPLKFNIYKCKFTDIKDFDNDFIETNFANFEYEVDDELIVTEESKLYVTNKKTGSTDDFKFGSDVVNIPTSSEYTSNQETFRVNKINKTEYELTKLWNKNPNFVKWGFKNSLCANDYPYMLNNSLLADPFNRTTNYVEPVPKRVEKNLDYFLSINSDSNKYTHHSLHVEDQVGGNINTNFKFELNKYLGIGYDKDYFTYFFGKRNEYDKGRVLKNNKRWSIFNGDLFDFNTTVFKGLKFNIRKVIDSKDLNKISTTNTEEFTDYKFSVLLSENEHDVVPDVGDLNIGKVRKKINTLKWLVIDGWKSGKSYDSDTLVLWNESIYKAKKNNVTFLPNNPTKDTENWDFYTESDTIFWHPYRKFNSLTGLGFLDGQDVIYNSGQYLFYDSTGIYDFWYYGGFYVPSNVVYYKGKYYEAIIETSATPTDEKSWREFDPKKPREIREFWLNKIWKPVPEWKKTRVYNNYALVTFGGVLYGTLDNIENTDLTPVSDKRWIKIHSFVPDTNTIYGPSNSQNNIVRINEQIYMCLDNTPYIPSVPDETVVDNSLDDGIAIYINKKFKNILMNIYVNDNTFSNSVKKLNTWYKYNDKISNIKRDKLYESLLYKFTASNVFNYLFYPTKSFGFINKIKYIFINEDSSINIYDFNVPESAKNLPFILYPHYSNKISVQLGQIKTNPIEVDQNILKPNQSLEDGLVTTKSTLNYYSDLPLATSIEYVDPMTKPKQKTLAQKEVVIYRHSGFYSPIFKEIELFKANTFDKEYNNFKFDTELTDFGMTGEIVISKVNRSGSQLKLKNSTKFRPIYPMLDEIGYHVVKRFIFKSTWDFDYYFECEINSRTDNTIEAVKMSQQSSIIIGEDKIFTIKKCD